jgi:hypothetical protein
MFIGAESALLATAITIGHLKPDATYMISCIKARPWLEVEVKTRAPQSDAPMQALNAECSDSTGTNAASTCPDATYSLSLSTMMVCGVMGYAEIKSTSDCLTA